MSLDGHLAVGKECVADALRIGEQRSLVVCTIPMPAGAVFDWHIHADHQLAWAASGILSVRTENSAWVLPPTRALWIPAGVKHETISEGAATMRTCYVSPHACAIGWTDCTPVVASPLLAELISYLEEPLVDCDQRDHAAAVLVGLLRPVATVSFDVKMPADERARVVAEALVATPSDRRTLAEWGDEVGASERTLARAFISDTGIPFGRWRSLLRLRAATVALAGGSSVGNAAALVGYESTSAFVSAFRRETGVTPGSYFGEVKMGTKVLGRR